MSALKSHLFAVVGLWFSVWAINYCLTVPGVDWTESVITGCMFTAGLKSLLDAFRETKARR